MASPKLLLEIPAGLDTFQMPTPEELTPKPKRDQYTCKFCFQSGFPLVSLKHLHQVLCARNLTNRYQDDPPEFTISEKIFLIDLTEKAVEPTNQSTNLLKFYKSQEKPSKNGFIEKQNLKLYLKITEI